MDWKYWAKNTSEYPDVQTTIEEQLENIIQMYFKGSGDYALEKLVKTFCEPLAMLERHLKRTEFPKVTALWGTLQMKQYNEILDRIKRVMKSEVRRQTRHYITFLTEVKTVDNNTLSATQTGR